MATRRAGYRGARSPQKMGFRPSAEVHRLRQPVRGATMVADWQLKGGDRGRGVRDAAHSAPPVELAAQVRIRSWLHASSWIRSTGRRRRPAPERRACGWGRATRANEDGASDWPRPSRWSVAEAQRYLRPGRRSPNSGPGPAACANSDALLRLADRLEGQPPHRQPGLAMVSHLVHDAESPLYNGQGPKSLAGAIEAAHEALDD